MSWAKLLRRDFRIWAISAVSAVLGYLVMQLVLAVFSGHKRTIGNLSIIDLYFSMLLLTCWLSRFAVGAPVGVRLNEVLDAGCSWLQRLREKAQSSGVDEIRLFEMDSHTAMGATAVPPNLVLLPCRLKQLLDPEGQFAVAVRELAHLIQINDHERDAERQRWIGATLAAAALFSGGIVSLVDHWLTGRDSWLWALAVVLPIGALAYALCALTAAGAEGFCNSTTAVDAKSVSMGVDPRILLTALMRIGFADNYFSAKRAPKFVNW